MYCQSFRTGIDPYLVILFSKSHVICPSQSEPRDREGTNHLMEGDPDHFSLLLDLTQVGCNNNAMRGPIRS